MVNKPIIFIDFFKTLNHDIYWRSLPFKDLERIQEFLFRNNTTLVDDWMRGKYTAEQINHMVSGRLNIPYEYLWNVFVQDCQTMTVPNGILESINKLRDRYTTILLTDNMDSFTRFTKPALKLENYFDLISNSFVEGKHKTDNDGELFLKYIKLHSANIKNCVSLDDSQSVQRIFTKLGGISYLVTLEHNISYYLEKII
jgi:FMN phosphatase YigB (HAD superfamily)